MTDNKHTSGPWHTRNNPGDWGLPGVVFIEDAENNVLATIDYRTPYCIGESSTVIDQAKTARSNAQLMSAAPDLLGAMRFILAFYEPGQNYLDTNAWIQAEASARRAVAKAEGN